MKYYSNIHLIDYRMWGGPLDPSGSYNRVDQYSDGTSVFRPDFTHDNYPDLSRHHQISVGLGSMFFGDLDYFNIASPSASCPSVSVKDHINGNIYQAVSNHIDGDKKRAVVCLCNLYNKDIFHTS